MYKSKEGHDGGAMVREDGKCAGKLYNKTLVCGFLKCFLIGNQSLVEAALARTYIYNFIELKKES